MTNIVERVKDGMRESARLYGWVNNVYGTIEHIDTQVMEGLAGNVFPFPVFYAIRTAPEKDKFKVLRFFLEKDLTEGTHSGYLRCINDPKNGWSGLDADLLDGNSSAYVKASTFTRSWTC